MISRSESETSQRFPGKRKKLGAMYEVLTRKNQDIVAFSTFGVNYCGNFGKFQICVLVNTTILLYNGICRKTS